MLSQNNAKAISGELLSLLRSSRPEVFLRKGVLKIYKFTGEHPCRSVISIKLLFRALFLRNTSRWLLLK